MKISATVPPTAASIRETDNEWGTLYLSKALAPADSMVPMINAAAIGIIRAFATARVPITTIANSPLKTNAMTSRD